MHEKKCQPQGADQIGCTTTIPTLASPLSSAFAMITPVNTCQSQGAAELETDDRGTPTPSYPLSYVQCSDDYTGPHMSSAR